MVVDVTRHSAFRLGKQFALSTLVCLLNFRCVTLRGDDRSRNGMNPDRLAYIPARTAILPCQRWPSTSSFESLRLTNASKEEISAICTAFDEFIIAGFESQPFMQGMTPRFVQKLLSQATPPVTINAGFATWQREAQDCTDCDTPLEFYTRSIAQRETWRMWLHQTSKATRDADAMLIPFLVYAYKDKVNNRGVVEARRVGGVLIILIDTSTGEVIWSQTRDAEVSNKKLQTDPGSNQLEVPTTDTLLSRLLTQDLWLEYPGRQSE